VGAGKWLGHIFVLLLFIVLLKENSSIISMINFQVHRLQVRCSVQEEFSPTKEKVNLKDKEFNLPVQPKQSDAGKKTREDATHFSRATWSKALQEVKSKVAEQGASNLFLYGGAATLGVLLSGALLASLEPIP